MPKSNMVIVVASYRSFASSLRSRSKHTLASAIQFDDSKQSGKQSELSDEAMLAVCGNVTFVLAVPTRDAPLRFEQTRTLQDFIHPTATYYTNASMVQRSCVLSHRLVARVVPHDPFVSAAVGPRFNLSPVVLGYS